jgi:hypothetical protein
MPNWNIQRACRSCVAVIAFACAFVAGSSAIASADPATSSVPAPLPGVPVCNLPEQNLAHRDISFRDRIHVFGNQEVNGFGRSWVPYGISVAGGLQDGVGDQVWTPTIAASMAQIKAAPFWHSNTVRVQWSEDNVFSDLDPGATVNSSFLDALCQQVQQIRRQGEVAVLNDNTEFGDWQEYDPTSRTELAWQAIYQEFGDQPGWIADLFNEPRVALHDPQLKETPAGRSYVWELWRSGGEFEGQQFVGMQQLVDFTRSIGFKGVEWIEGPIMMGLRQALQYQIQDPLNNYAWAYHHPSLPWSAARGRTKQWETGYGYLTLHQPVVDGEWNQSAASRSECKPAAYYVVPAYLRWLRRKGIGLVVWSLQPGSMVAEPAGERVQQSDVTSVNMPTAVTALERPSKMWPNYACNAQRTGQGAGQLVLRYFRKYGP